METHKEYGVGVIGVSEMEQMVLKSIFLLSRSRPRSYHLKEERRSADILLVNADQEEAVAAWKAMGGQGQCSTALMLTRSREAPPGVPSIRLPLVATRVLNSLDQFAIKFLGQGSETAFGVTDALASRGRRSSLVELENPSYRALVVDDSLPVRRQLEQELKRFGAQADMAESGERAKELLAQNRYDIVFLDVILPGVDGYDICKTIKRDKALKKTPVVMLTSKSSPFDRIKGTLSGCNNYLTKPVNRVVFLKVVRSYLERELVT